MTQLIPMVLVVLFPCSAIDESAIELEIAHCRTITADEIQAITNTLALEHGTVVLQQSHASEGSDREKASTHVSLACTGNEYILSVQGTSPGRPLVRSIPIASVSVLGRGRLLGLMLAELVSAHTAALPNIRTTIVSRAEPKPMVTPKSSASPAGELRPVTHVQGSAGPQWRTSIAGAVRISGSPNTSSGSFGLRLSLDAPTFWGTDLDARIGTISVQSRGSKSTTINIDADTLATTLDAHLYYVLYNLRVQLGLGVGMGMLRSTRFQEGAVGYAAGSVRPSITANFLQHFFFGVMLAGEYRQYFSRLRAARTGQDIILDSIYFHGEVSAGIRW